MCRRVHGRERDRRLGEWDPKGPGCPEGRERRTDQMPARQRKANLHALRSVLSDEAQSLEAVRAHVGRTEVRVLGFAEEHDASLRAWRKRANSRIVRIQQRDAVNR